MVTLSFGLHDMPNGWQFSCSFSSPRDEGSLVELGKWFFAEAKRQFAAEDDVPHAARLTITLHSEHRRLLDESVAIHEPRGLPWTQVMALQLLLAFFSRHAEKPDMIAPVAPPF